MENEEGREREMKRALKPQTTKTNRAATRARKRRRRCL